MWIHICCYSWNTQCARRMLVLVLVHGNDIVIYAYEIHLMHVTFYWVSAYNWHGWRNMHRLWICIQPFSALLFLKIIASVFQSFFCLSRLLSVNLVHFYMYDWDNIYISVIFTHYIVPDQELFAFWTAVRCVLLILLHFLLFICSMAIPHEWCIYIYTTNAWTSVCPYVRFSHSAVFSCVPLSF